MKYDTLFFPKIKKDVKNLSSVAVAIGVLGVKFLLTCDKTCRISPKFNNTYVCNRYKLAKLIRMGNSIRPKWV